MGDFNIQKFEESGRENGVRYWYAHEFMRALGYDSLPAFQNVGAEVRQVMVKHSGVPPESLPIEANISTVKSRLKATARAMRKLDSKNKKTAADRSLTGRGT